MTTLDWTKDGPAGDRAAAVFARVAGQHPDQHPERYENRGE